MQVHNIIHVHVHVHMLTDVTSADEVVNSSLLPLEHVPSLPAAEVQHSGSIGQVAANQDALHPVVEVTHVEYWTLKDREYRHVRITIWLTILDRDK